MQIRNPKNTKLSSVKSMIVFLIGWILLYPVIKFGAEARINHEVNESFFIYIHIIGSFLIVLISFFTPIIYSIDFKCEERFLIVKKADFFNNKKEITISYFELNYKVFNSFGTKHIAIFKDRKRKLKIEPSEFSKEQYEQIIRELNKIKKEHYPIK